VCSSDLDYTGVADTNTDPYLGSELSYGNVSGGQKALRIDGVSSYKNLITRQLDRAKSGDNYFFSFLMRWGNGLDSDDFIMLWIDNQTADWHRTGMGQSKASNQFYIRLSDSNGYDGSMTEDTTYHIVAHFKKAHLPGDDRFTLAKLYVNPEVDDFTNDKYDGIAAVGTGHPLTSFDTIGIMTGGGIENDDVIFFDELKIGTTWKDVVPKPALPAE